MVVITVSGTPGSGKSSVASYLSSQLGLRHVSAGDLFRRLAAERNMSVVDLNLVAQSDTSVDREVDGMSVDEAKKGNVIIEGHITGWIVKQADLRIYLDAPLPVRADRIAKREAIDFHNALEQTSRREESERLRYKSLYGIDTGCLNGFDIVLNTSKWEMAPMLRIVTQCIRETLVFGSQK
jgi:cytidylate kinase